MRRKIAAVLAFASFAAAGCVTEHVAQPVILREAGRNVSNGTNFPQAHELNAMQQQAVDRGAGR